MAEYTGPATENESVVIAQMNQRKLADRYGTDDQQRLNDPNAKRIHNDIYERFGQDTPVDDPC